MIPWSCGPSGHTTPSASRNPTFAVAASAICSRPGRQQRVVEPGSLGSPGVELLLGGEVLQVGVRAHVIDREEPLRRRDRARLLDRHDGLETGAVAIGGAVALSDVDPNGRVDRRSERVTNQLAGAVAVEARIEHLAVRLLEPAEVEIQSPRRAVSHLHRGEVHQRRRRGPRRFGVDGSPVDLKSHEAPP